jgi:hypothetical protein
MEQQEFDSQWQSISPFNDNDMEQIRQEIGIFVQSTANNNIKL